MSYKFAVAPIVNVPVRLVVNDGDKAATFKFSLQCERLNQAEVSERVKDDSQTVKDFMTDVTKGWTGQTLVLEESTGKPADFCADALAALFNFPGAAFAAYQSYLKEFGAKEKN